MEARLAAPSTSTAPVDQNILPDGTSLFQNSKAVEMSDLERAARADDGIAQQGDSRGRGTLPNTPDISQPGSHGPNWPLTSNEPLSITPNPPEPNLPDKQEVITIGTVPGASTNPVPEPASPKVGITLLMPTGQRSEWRFDQKYLEKRNVTVPDGNPFKISVYTLKELMLREWRADWGPQPSSPSAIRLITLGKLLDDKVTLEDCKFTTNALAILHMTVKPQDIMDEEDAKISKHGGRVDRDGNERTPRCRCMIM